jgi:hypothetical protein
MHKNRMFLILLAALAFVACSREPEDRKIELPSDGALTLYRGWGVVLTNYIRLRTTPDPEGVEVTALAKRSLVRILDKGSQATVKGVTDFWYEIEAGLNRGWLFGQHLAVFHKKEEAEKAAAELE